MTLHRELYGLEPLLLASLMRHELGMHNVPNLLQSKAGRGCSTSSGRVSFKHRRINASDWHLVEQQIFDFNLNYKETWSLSSNCTAFCLLLNLYLHITCLKYECQQNHNIAFSGWQPYKIQHPSEKHNLFQNSPRKLKEFLKRSLLWVFERVQKSAIP